MPAKIATNSPIRTASEQPSPPPPASAIEGGQDVKDPQRRQRLRLPPGVDWEDIYRTTAIIEAMLSMPRAPRYFKDVMFPTTQTHATDHVWIDYWKGSQQLAPFVSKFSKGSVVPRERYKSNIFSPPMSKPIKVLTADDMYQRYPGTIDPLSDAEMLATDLVDLDLRISRLEEWMCCRCIFEGAVPIVDWDSGRPLAKIEYEPVHLTVPGLPWTDAASKPLTDLKACIRAISGAANEVATEVVFGGVAADLFEDNESVKDMYNKFQIDPGTLTPRLREWGLTSLGSYRGLELTINETSYLAKDGTREFYMPQNYVFMAARSPYGSMQYAGVAQKNDPSTFLEIYASDRVPLIWFPENADVRKCRLSSRPCPVPPPVETWIIMKVD